MATPLIDGWLAPKFAADLSTAANTWQLISPKAMQRLSETGHYPLVDKEPRFRALFDENFAPLERYARRRGLGVDETDDLVASTFEVVWRRLDEVPDDHEAVLWLYGIAYNQLRNHRRTKRRQARLVARLPPASSLSVSFELNDIPADAIKSALAALAFDDREVIMLAAAEGLGAVEIGIVLGCNANTARSRLHRARNRLAHLLTSESRLQRPQRIGHESNENDGTKESTT